MINKITIVGVGLIGGSLARALKEKNLAKTVFGYGRDRSRLDDAKKSNIIDDYSTQIEEAVNHADIIVIATPVGTFRNIFSKVKSLIADDVIISDVGSTKTNIVDIAKEILGDKSQRFVPAHPIAGKEKSGFEASDGNLYNGKKVIITPIEDNSSKSIQVIESMWKNVGAEVDFMSPQSHDDLLGMTSHLPHMLAFSLVNYLVDQNPSASIYAGGGFKDFSRIASGDAVMWRDICLQNKDKIITHLRGYQSTVEELIDAIDQEESDKLELLFATAKKTRDSWIG